VGRARERERVGRMLLLMRRRMWVRIYTIDDTEGKSCIDWKKW
jgi:hypothetical protein